MRNKYRLKNIMRKKHLTQPARGPFHHRTPNKKKQLTRLREAAIAVVDKIVPKINFGDSKIKIGTL